jgi:hypothetical protein
MKRIIVLLLVVFSAIGAISCGKLKQFPVGPLELAAGGPDNSTYPFESQADVNMFSLNGGIFTSMSFSTDRAYEGNGCVKIACNFNAPNSAQGRLVMNNVVLSTLAGKTITAAVWVPTGMFTTSSPYGGLFYFQLGSSGNNDWYQSTWVNLNTASGSVAGMWNIITAQFDTMLLANGNSQPGHIDNDNLVQNNVDTTQSVTWGVVVGQGSASPNFSGYIYIDSINIQ